MNYNTDINEEMVLNSEEKIRDTMKALRPYLDLRSGTALADLLINPGGVIHGLVENNIDVLKKSLSIIDAPNQTDPDMELITDLLSNILVSMKTGEKASGVVRFNLSGTQRFYLSDDYYLNNGSLNYYIDSAYEVIDSQSTPNDGINYVIIQQDDNGYYCLLPFTAENVGKKYNLETGSALFFPAGSDANAIEAKVHTAFTGGDDPETLEELNARLPDMMSNNTLTSPAGIIRTLTLLYDSVYDVSIVGMGMIEQSRGRHNIFGMDMGGRVDAHLRPFRAPKLSSIQIDGVKTDDDGMYEANLWADELDGIYMVRAVNSMDSVLTADDGSGNLIGSYPFIWEFISRNTSESRHDFSSDSGELIRETAFTKWGGIKIIVGPVSNLVADDGSAYYPDTIKLEIEYYTIPHLISLQEYVDQRTSESDLVVRGAVPIYISFSADVFVAPEISLDYDAMKRSFIDYINSKKIGEAIGISELASIAHKYDIKHIDFYANETLNLLAGQIIDQDGSETLITSATIDPANINNMSSGFSERTAFVTADLGDVYINERRG